MKVIVPPIKSQGIKTKLVPWIKEVAPKVNGRWIEPFLGTGVVAFNSGYKKAILNDTNPHIINYTYIYKQINLMSKSKQNKTTHAGLTPENYIRKKGRSLPIYKCLINNDWKAGGLSNIFIVRQHANGNVTFCLYLVDQLCLGVKDSFFSFNIPPEMLEYRIKKGEHMFVMEEISYDLAHNIILASLEYAEEYGFKPHKNFTSITRHFMEEDNDNIPLIDIKCGMTDGKPMYVNNGYETPAQVKKIIRQLEKTAGKGNFGFMINEEDADLLEEDEEATDEVEADGGKDTETETFSVFTKYLKCTVGETCTDPELLNKAMVLADSWLKKNNVINCDLSDEYMKMMRNDFLSVVTVKSGDVPNSLFPTFTTGGRLLEIELFRMFTSIYNEGSNSRNAKKQINLFMKKYGDCEIVAYFKALLISNFQSDTSREVERQYNRFPDYFLVKLSRKDQEWITSPPPDRMEARKQLMAMVDGATITEFEMMQFILCYLIHVFDIRDNDADNLLEATDALFRLMKSNTLNYLPFIIDLIMVYAENRRMYAAIVEFFKRNQVDCQ